MILNKLKSQFIMVIHTHPSIVGDRTDLDEVQLVKYLGESQTAILMSKVQELK